MNWDKTNPTVYECSSMRVYCWPQGCMVEQLSPWSQIRLTGEDAQAVMASARIEAWGDVLTIVDSVNTTQQLNSLAA